MSGNMEEFGFNASFFALDGNSGEIVLKDARYRVIKKSGFAAILIAD